MARVQYGINLGLDPNHPDDTRSRPRDAADLSGLTWTRLVFKVAAARLNEVEEAYAAYDPLIERYSQLGIHTLLVLNQETYWKAENTPWYSKNLDAWKRYADGFAEWAGKIAAHYRGKKVSYEIWNEGDIPPEDQPVPTSVYAEPHLFAPVLERAATAIRRQDPEAQVVLGGLAAGLDKSSAYIANLRDAMGGDIPVDGIGFHPYGHWPPSGRPDIPTGWHGTMEHALDTFVKECRDKPIWLTEIGVSEPNGIAKDYWKKIAKYVEDTLTLVEESYASQVPVVIWFAWSDWMRGAGIVDREGKPKQPIYDKFFELSRAPADDTPQTSPIPAPTDLMPTESGLRVRTGPGTGFDVVTTAEIHDRLTPLEPWATVWSKLNQDDEWIKVRTQFGDEGWSAAWYLRLAVDIPDEAPQIVTPTEEWLRVREGPGLQFDEVVKVFAGDLLDVEEDWPMAVAKLGRYGEWINIRTPQGREGWSAAWFLRLPTEAELAGQDSHPAQPKPTDISQENLRRALSFERELSFNRLPICDPAQAGSFGGFGPNNYAYLTYARGEDYYRNLQGLHNGLDWGMAVGTLLCSVDWGVVAHVSQREEDNPYSAGPYTIIIRYGDHVALYGHLKGAKLGRDVFVQEGDIVRPGQTIALSGTANNSPHLHFEMRKISQAYINQLRRETEGSAGDTLERLRHMQYLFHVRGWNPTQTYYVNPAPFFDPPLEHYQQQHNWGNACRLREDTTGNGYPDQVLRAGESAPTAYDMYSMKAMAAWGPHFWQGSVSLIGNRGLADAGATLRGGARGAVEDQPPWHYVG